VRRKRNNSAEGSEVVKDLGAVKASEAAVAKASEVVALRTGKFADRYKTALSDRYRIMPEEKGQAILLGLFLSVVCIATLLLAPQCTFSQDSPASSILSATPVLSGNTEAAFVSYKSPEAHLQTEFRALWVLRNTLVSEREIDRMLRRAKDAGFNVLFVQVRGRGDAFYNSAIEPRAELLSDARFDPLSYLIAEAHRNGFEVHPWLNVFLVWAASWKPADTKHVLLSHPDWVAVRSDGRPLSELSRDEIEAMGIEGVFLAPGNPQVREHIRAVIRELVQNYNVDGIHLDYIRYPTMTVGYDPGTRTEFMRRYGVDPDQIANDGEVLVGLFGDKGFQDLGIRWDEWRVSDLEGLIDSVHCDLKAVNPGVKLSAAVIADQQSATARHGQDWPSWLKRGALDFAVPMCYSASTRFVQTQVRSIQNLVGAGKFYPGIAMYNQSPGRVVEKVRLLRQLGITGFSLFCYDPEHQRDAVLRELSRSVFAFPARPWGEPQSRP
jgi:uncharacterized lipoprotein YddW (UPF0748 family)